MNPAVSGVSSRILSLKIGLCVLASPFLGCLTLQAVALEPPSASPTSAKPLPPHVPVAIPSPVQDKNFYLLSLFERTPAVAEALTSQSILKQLTDEEREKLPIAFKTSETDVPAAINSLIWSPERIDRVATVLRELYTSNTAVKQCVDGPLRQSGMYVRYQGDSGDQLLEKAWRDAANGINRLLQVYGLGTEPRYPKIDSVAYPVDSAFYKEVVNMAFAVLADDAKANTLFFQPSLHLGMELMDVNHRDEAGRFEPMELGENKAAFERVRSVQWFKYPYSVILVPGHGPDEEKVAISPKATLLLAAIAKRFREGKAPYILVSGGFVHPNQTPYCEAIEMKRVLMSQYGIPANAIIIDPHARHTTTNMRNAARLMYRYGIPFDKPGLVTSIPAQIRAINNQKFEARCERELGYQPHRIVESLSPLDLVFVPQIQSLQIDPTDPLDP